MNCSNDGIDVDSSTYVTITNSSFDTADDGICIKSTVGYGEVAFLTVTNVTVSVSQFTHLALLSPHCPLMLCSGTLTIFAHHFCRLDAFFTALTDVPSCA
jgi:polygalacturonase